MESSERTQETPALIKMLAMSAESLEEGLVRSADEAFAGIRERLRTAATCGRFWSKGC